MLPSNGVGRLNFFLAIAHNRDQKCKKKSEQNFSKMILITCLISTFVSSKQAAEQGFAGKSGANGQNQKSSQVLGCLLQGVRLDSPY